MELRSPKAKKKDSVARLKMWGQMLRVPLLIVFLMGTINCNDSDFLELTIDSVPSLNSNSTSSLTDFGQFKNGVDKWRGENETSIKNSDNRAVLSDIRYLRRHLNREIVNFIMTDTLVDGEIENRVHFDGITAKETYVGADG